PRQRLIRHLVASPPRDQEHLGDEVLVIARGTPPEVPPHVVPVRGVEGVEVGHMNACVRHPTGCYVCVSGRAARTVVPAPGGESSVSCPPSASTRSARPRSPVPPDSGSAPPRPSSVISTRSSPCSVAMRT